jgi:hypothetical protein
MPAGWTRVGGSSGDWEVRADTTKTFAQDHAVSSTLRISYASGASGAPWSGATTLNATAQLLALGSSGTFTALVCVRYTAAGDFECLALQAGPAGQIGAQFRTKVGGTNSTGPLWTTTTITTGVAYAVKISVDASGVLTATLNGTALGTFTPPTPIASGFVAVGTQSAEAQFDNVVVTQP